MKNKNKLLLAALVTALIVSMLGAGTAFADDGTPPPDVPATEEVLPPVEESSAPEENPAADETSAPETPVEEDLSAALEQLPADSGLLVLDASGDAVPLASNEAAEIIAAADPYFWDGAQYVGYTSGISCPAMVTVCNTGVANPITAAVAAFAGTPAASGAIYVEAGTYNENVSINGVANLSGLIGAGSGVTTLNGSISVTNMNAFTVQGFTVNGQVSASSNSGTLQLTDLNVTNPAGTGIFITNHNGDIVLTNVDASDNNGTGTYLDNSAGSGTITLNGVNKFNNNSTSGLVVASNGDINASGVTATGNSSIGAHFSTPGNVTLSGANVFSGNTADGLVFASNVNNATVNAAISNNSGSGIENYVGGILTLNCVTFGANGTDISGPGNMVDSCANTGSSGSGGVTSAFICPPPVVKTLPNGDKVIFFCADAEAPSAQSAPQTKLPGALDGAQGAFISSLIAVETENDAPKPSPATITVSFTIPADMKDANLAILYWDGSKWVEVGGQRAGDFFEVTVNFTGTFVLVKK